MDAFRRNVWLSFGTLLTSVTTLVCCVLPAVLVTLGAGAAVVGLVNAVPQLIWLSERKGLVFGMATAMLAISGLALWRARSLPCPSDPRLAGACQRVRRFSNGMLITATVLVAVGAFVTFALPAMIS
jgi:hypothetical protein